MLRNKIINNILGNSIRKDIISKNNSNENKSFLLVVDWDVKDIQIIDSLENAKQIVKQKFKNKYNNSRLELQEEDTGRRHLVD